MSATGAVARLAAHSASAAAHCRRPTTAAAAARPAAHSANSTVSTFPRPVLAVRRGVTAHAASGASSRERGEWTKFLDVVVSGTHCEVDLTHLDDDKALEIVVTAPDRPGLLQDITRAIAECGLTIEEAKVTTPGKSAKDTFVVKQKDGKTITHDQQVAIKAAILKSASTTKVAKARSSEGMLGHLAAAVAADTDVQVQSYDMLGQQPSFVITFTTVDRPGLLALMTSAMDKLGLEIYTAEIKTRGGYVSNKFHTSKVAGMKVGELQDALKQALSV